VISMLNLTAKKSLRVACMVHPSVHSGKLDRIYSEIELGRSGNPQGSSSTG